jgi:hypothetical protein
MGVFCEKKGYAAVAWLKTTTPKPYQDRYRLLSKDIPLVVGQDRGEIFAVFDGTGGAPKARESAQEMSDSLLRFFQEPERFSPSRQGIYQFLMEGNISIYNWGLITGTDRPWGSVRAQSSGSIRKRRTLFMPETRLLCT